MSVDSAEEYLNTHTGLMGLTGESDLRVILARAEKRDRDALTALDMYVHRLNMAFGASRSVLGGIDAIVLTATVLERNAAMRTRIVAGLSNEGVRLDPHVNECLFERAGRISDHESTIPVYMIPTHEMREIARVAESFVL
jgi:acetate kinase